MMEEMESLWQAMKGNHYKRVIEQITKSIHETNILDDALTVALENVVTAIHAETGTLWFYDRFGTGRIHPRAVWGGSDLSGITLSPGEGIAGRVIEIGRATIIKDCQADPRWAGRVDEKTGFKTLSMICVPLTVEGQTFGSIQVINNRKGQLFDDKDLSLCENLAIEISKLIREKGLLKDYLTTVNTVQKPEKEEITFREVFIDCNIRNIGVKLAEVPEYAMLGVREQQKVLQLSKEILGCFEKRKKF